MIPDIFIATAAHSVLRQKMFELVWEWWKWAGFSPHYISTPANKWSTFEFDRRGEAEKRATTPIYILSDDDCLPLVQYNHNGKEWLEGALEIVSKYPQFGCLSAFHDNEPTGQWDN